MKNLWIPWVLLLFSAHSLAMDIYKCGGQYTNTTETNGPKELEARGCKRLALTTDPISVNGLNEITIKIDKDGHFRLQGRINDKPVVFIVDTGATLVSVSEDFANSANLKGGSQVTMLTANGTRRGRVIDDVSVTAGSFTAPRVKVSIGLSGLGPNEALLGQSFLSQFEITLDDRQMIMRNKKK